MSHCVVRLNGTEEVEEFVKAASKCDFDIDIFYNRVIIDAKSILGILSMDLNRDLTVHCYGDSPAFNKTLQKFAVAEILVRETKNIQPAPSARVDTEFAQGTF